MINQPDNYLSLAEIASSIGSKMYQPTTLEAITSLGNKIQEQWTSPLSQLSERLQNRIFQPTAFDSVRLLQECTKNAYGLNSYLKNLDTLSKSLLPFTELSESLIQRATVLQELQKTILSGNLAFLNQRTHPWTFSDKIIGEAFLETPQEAIDYFSRKTSQEALECVLQDTDITREIEALVEQRDEDYVFQEAFEVIVQHIVQLLHKRFGWKKARTGRFVVFFFFLIVIAKDTFKSFTDSREQEDRQQQVQHTIRQETGNLKEAICEELHNVQPNEQFKSEADFIVNSCLLRAKPTKRSRVIGQLVTGNKVIILRKKPNLCLVQLVTNSNIIGWVEQKNLAGYQ